MKEVGYAGEIVFDTLNHYGTPLQLMHIAKLHNRGWKHKINLEEGLKLAYHDFLLRGTQYAQIS